MLVLKLNKRFNFRKCFTNSNTEMVQIISYDKGLKLAQEGLKSFPRGQLKAWCKQKKLTYQTIINLKNNKLPVELPTYVSAILEAQGYHCLRLHTVHEEKALALFIIIPKAEATLSGNQKLGNRLIKFLSIHGTTI